MEELHIITSIKLINNKNKCTIELDNQSSFECSNDLVMKYRLHKEKPISDEEISQIAKEQKVFEIKQAAMHFASYKPRTSKQIMTKLKILGFTDEDIEIAINFLHEFNLLNDEKYARNLVNDWLQRKPSSELKLINELKRRGIEKELAIDIVNQMFPASTEDELVRQATEKKIKSIRKKPPDKQYDALVGHLKRLGFDWKIIKKVINEYSIPKKSGYL